MASLDARVTAMEARQDHQSDQIAQFRAEMGEFRAEMREFRAEMRAEIRDVHGEMRGLREEVRADMRDLRQDMNSKFLWVLGIQMATLLTIVGVLLSATYRP